MKVTTLPADINPWGMCVVKDCGALELRCFHGRCARHCEERCITPDGTKTHAARTNIEINQLMPHYNPTTPTLVCEMNLREAM